MGIREILQKLTDNPRTHEEKPVKHYLAQELEGYEKEKQLDNLSKKVVQERARRYNELSKAKILETPKSYFSREDIEGMEKVAEKREREDTYKELRALKSKIGKKDITALRKAQAGMEKEREKLSKLLLSKKAFKEKKALDLARKQLSAKEYRRLLLQRRVSKVSENLGKDIRASLKKQPLSVGAMQRVFTERFKPRARGYVMGSPSSNILAAGNNAFTSNQIQEERRRKLSNLSMSSMWIIFMGGQK